MIVNKTYPKNKKTLLIDVDDTVANLVTTWIELYNADFDDHLVKSDIREWAIHTFVKPECGTKIYDYLKDSNTYWGVDEIENALMAVNLFRKNLNNSIKIKFATAKDYGNAKTKWLIEHKFMEDENDLIVCYDKSLLMADLLIDDGLINITSFHGHTILLDQPWNKQHFLPLATGEYFFHVRCKDWIEIANIVLNNQYELFGVK